MGSFRQSALEPIERDSRRFGSASRHSLGLAQRLALFVLIFAAEWIPVSNLVHKDTGAGALLQLAVVFASLLLAFGYAGAKTKFQHISDELKGTPIAWGRLGIHFCALLAFIWLSGLPFGGGRDSTLAYAIPAAWLTSGVVAIAFAGFALIPPRLIFELARSTDRAWAYALVVGVIAWRLVGVFSLWNGSFWEPLTNLTFSLVRAFLHPFLSVVVADRAAMTIGSPNFNVTILPWCSGFEGTALMLVFSIAWLWFVRRELRFPRALLLVPAAMAVIWVSNALRITALILIGVAGAPAIALGGFHSQAGWIAFNAIALSFAVTATRLPWFAARPNANAPPEVAISTENPVAAYLMPFLMILGVAMISRAVTSGMEWLYPLRFLGAAIALWIFRRKYAALEWKFGWAAPLVGCIVFAIWIALDRVFGTHGNSTMGAALASVPAAARIGWLAFRTIGAVVTVPIAEELAFRGFLLRRLTSSNFESISFRQFSFFAFFVSSVAFGVMHGDRWFAGTVAGMLYAGVLLWRGRVGDAVIAHATTNALIAGWVLFSGSWDLW
jgi:exosortase E/protease (VPEID-CTERM system)